MKQPKWFFVTSFLSFYIFSLLTIGCNKSEDNPPPGSTTIADLIIADPNFSLLEETVTKAELIAALKEPGPFTLFAADNTAFSMSGINSSTIAGLTQEQAEATILYQTLPGKILAVDIPVGSNAKLITLSGDSVFVTKNVNGIYVNGLKVVQPDINTSNGIVHKIEKVLMPPTGNIAETVQQKTGTLDSLAKAISRAANETGGDPTLVTLLETAQLTLFAPSNTAFTNLLSAMSLTDINDIPMPTLLDMLRYHIVSGRTFSSDFADESLAMLAGGNTTVNLTNGTSGGPTITGNGNGGINANIVTTNIMTNNGVVHVIDNVLLP